MYVSYKIDVLSFFLSYLLTLRVIITACSSVSAVWYCTVLHCTALHCTALHCTALHCTKLLHCMADRNMGNTINRHLTSHQSSCSYSDCSDRGLYSRLGIIVANGGGVVVWLSASYRRPIDALSPNPRRRRGGPHFLRRFKDVDIVALQWTVDDTLTLRLWL